jgi:hypothetical protein
MPLRTGALRRLLGAALFAAAMVTVARNAHAYCRTMACPLPPDFSPSESSCVPDGFASYCASLSPPAKAIPVWWRNACVSYDIQQNASAQVPFDTATTMFAQAFAKWTSITCADPADADAAVDGGEGSGSSRVSIDVRDLGPVECDLHQYNQYGGPNQHVIIFHDDVWPYPDDANNTLGLTTVTYDPDTGEIFDADMEINSTVPLAVADPVPSSGYDFDSIITHECGHFLGMAHSGDDRATMFASYTPGTTYKRILTEDDVAGLCSIYLPGGARSVDPSVTPDGSGQVPEDSCDPTPRHGFTTECASPPPKGCDVAAEATAGAERGSPWMLLGACGVFAAFRRRRARRVGLQA